MAPSPFLAAVRAARSETRALPPLARGLDRTAVWLDGVWARHRMRSEIWMARAERVAHEARTLETLADDDLDARLALLRADQQSARPTSAGVTETAVATLGEALRRTLGFALHDVQWAAALALDAGALVELATGEGKTLSAGLVAALHGLAGRGCHVVTVNDYLATRDAGNLRPFYERCGLTVAAVVAASPPPERRRAHAADVTYGTARELAADHLRDRLRGAPSSVAALASGALRGEAPPPRMLAGRYSAIVDEADSVLIDDAVTPLLISEPDHAGPSAAELERADRIARAVGPTASPNPAGLSNTARSEVVRALEADGVREANQRRGLAQVETALRARRLERDVHYVVQDGAIVIVDEATGRTMPDRSWRHGLHEAVAVKEGLSPSGAGETRARISFQRFFRGYGRLCGLTGTAHEVRAELYEVYGLPVTRLRTHRPVRRTQGPTRVRRPLDAARTLLEEVKSLHATGRPVLIGTRSVRASEAVSRALREAGIAHEVLNARDDAREAEIVAGAGQPGAVTVATNMAGRGTDIPLGPGVAERGGLAVVATASHASPRVDRQLAGRAGRQGDPGSSSTVMSSDDDLFREGLIAPLAAAVAGLARARGGPAGRCLRGLVRLAQARVSSRARGVRRALLRSEEQREVALSFAPDP